MLFGNPGNDHVKLLGSSILFRTHVAKREPHGELEKTNIQVLWIESYGFPAGQFTNFSFDLKENVSNSEKNVLKKIY